MHLHYFLNAFGGNSGENRLETDRFINSGARWQIESFNQLKPIYRQFYK